MEQCEIRIENGLPVGKTYPSLMQSILMSTDFNLEKTLDLYGVTLLDEFKETGIENPTLKNILSFIEQDNINESKNLNEKDRQTILDISLQSSYIEDVKQRFIDAFNVEGNFGINIDQLKKSGLFSDTDIMYLVDTENLSDIQNLYYKLNKTDEVFEGISNNVIINTGVMTKYNPDKFLQDVYNYYVGLTDSDSILQKANEIGDDTIIENPSLIPTVLNLIKDKQALVPYETDENNGEVIPKVTNNQLNRLEQVNMNQDFSPLVAQVEYIKGEDKQLYVENLPMVYAYLRNIENQASDLGINIKGLAENAINKTYERTVDFLDDLYNYLTDVMNSNSETMQESLDNYINAHNDFFNVTPEVKPAIVDAIRNDGIYMHIETNRSEEDLFNTNSVIKVKDNVYQKVNDLKDLGYLYDILFDNSNLLPRSVYSAQVKNSNKDLILDDIDQYISGLSQDYLTENSDPETVKRMIAYKILFNIDNADTAEVITGEINLNPEKFLQSFNKEMLKNDTLENIFYFSNRGLEAKQILGDYTLRQLQNNLSVNTFNNLVQYAKLSGNESLNALTALDTEYATIPNNLRDYYANNMTQLNTYKNDYYKSNGYIVTDSTNDFIKVKNELYEQVAPNVYAKVERNDRYINSNLSKPAYDGSVEPDIVNQRGGRVTIKRANNITDERAEFC